MAIPRVEEELANLRGESAEKQGIPGENSRLLLLPNFGAELDRNSRLGHGIRNPPFFGTSEKTQIFQGMAEDD